MEVSTENEIAVCNLASICLPSLIESPEITQKSTIYYQGKLKMYSKEDCTYCKLLKQLLKDRQYEQIPQLSSGKKLDLTTKFSLL